MFRKSFLLVTLILNPILFPAIASAQEATLTAKVIRVDITPNEIYGGCLIKLNKSITDNATQPLDCPNDWVSFSCNGVFNSKDFAYHKLDLAKSALESGNDLVLTINDAKKDNGGYCFSERVGLTNQK